MEETAATQQSTSLLEPSTGEIVNSPSSGAAGTQESETERKLNQLTESQPSAAPPAQTPPEDVSETPSVATEPAKDLSWLDKPPSPTQETQAPPKPATPEFEKFSSDFEQVLGFPLEELRAGMSELQQFRQQVAQTETRNAIQQQESALQQEWGVSGDDFADRMEVIRQRFKSYSPEIQQRLDNVEGARLIWAKLQQEESETGIPVFQRSTGTGRTNVGKNKPQFTRSEIQRMSPDVYERYSAQIYSAYQQGLILDDLGNK